MQLDSRYTCKIRESALDNFGHVNHAEIFRILEEARWETITTNGYGLSEVLAEGKGPVILDAKARFKKELRLRETIVVTTLCTGYRGRIGFLDQKIFNDRDELCVEATFTVGLFDLHTRKLIPPTEKWLAALRQ